MMSLLTQLSLIIHQNGPIVKGERQTHLIDYDIPVYKSVHYRYIRISDLREEDRGQLERWVFGKFQPLIQGKEGALQDCVFLDDYKAYLSEIGT